MGIKIQPAADTLEQPALRRPADKRGECPRIMIRQRRAEIGQGEQCAVSLDQLHQHMTQLLYRLHRYVTRCRLKILATNSMFKGMHTTMRWLISLGAKFVRVAPGATLLVVLATLVSQVAVLLAFFLPLKVVILLGSEGMPRYFPAAFAEVDRDFLVVSLSVATVAFYCLHLLAERVVRFGTDAGTRQLLARSHKMVLFENQNEAAAKGYQRYSGALASGVFVLLALVVLAIVYPEMALFLSGFMVAMLGIFWVGYRFNPVFRATLEARLPDLINTAGVIGFLLAFAYLVADFIFWSPPGLIVAIISLLLSRQIFTRTNALVSNVRGLSQQRLRLDALYFHGKVLLPEQQKVEKGIGPLLAPSRRREWVTAVLGEFAGGVSGSMTFHWQQTGMPNVVALRVDCPGQDVAYLVKLFDTRRTAVALHEATLLAQQPEGLPAPAFVGATQVEGFHCHVFEWPRTASHCDKRFSKVAAQVRGALLAVEPPIDMTQRYARSRPMFWQYLDESLVERLRLAAEGESVDSVERFSVRLNSLRRQLHGLPLALINPDINTDNLVLVEEEAEYLLNWTQWSLEPVGAGWPVTRLQNLGKAFAEAAEKRPSLSDVELPQVELAALAYALDRAFKRQRYSDALALLPELLARMEDGE